MSPLSSRYLFAIVVICLVLTLPVVVCRPQIEHGSLLGPSGRFQRTRNQSAPPVDLSKSPIYLPEFIPIHEENADNQPAAMKA